MPSRICPWSAAVYGVLAEVVARGVQRVTGAAALDPGSDTAHAGSPGTSRAAIWGQGGLNAAALLVFVVPLYRFLRVALARFDYPFDLEWTEGGMLVNALRVVAHRPLYAAPSLEFIPFMYPPGYHVFVAALFRLAGPGYAAARLASIVATLGTGGLIFWLARRAGSAIPLALAWSGIWLTTYALSGFFFDLVRVDAVHTFLVVAAIATLLEDVRRPRRSTLALLVVLVLAAVLVKQDSFVFCPAIAAGLALGSGGRRALAFAGAICGALALSILVLQHGSQGWFWFYTAALPAHGRFDWSKVLRLVGRGGVASLPIAWLALPGLAALAGRSTRSPESDPPWKVLAIVLAAALVADVGIAGHSWGFVNVHMPLHACLVLVAAVACPALARAVGGTPGAVPGWLILAMALQVWATHFDLAGQVPDPRARADSQRVVEGLAAVEGRVLAPEFPWLLRQAGKPVCFHLSALADLEVAATRGLEVDLSPLQAEARQSVSAYLRGPAGLPNRLAPLFANAQPLGGDGRARWPPLDGVHRRPRMLLNSRHLPQRAAETPP